MGDRERLLCQGEVIQQVWEFMKLKCVQSTGTLPHVKVISARKNGSHCLFVQASLSVTLASVCVCVCYV